MRQVTSEVAELKLQQGVIMSEMRDLKRTVASMADMVVSMQAMMRAMMLSGGMPQGAMIVQGPARAPSSLAVHHMSSDVTATYQATQAVQAVPLGAEVSGASLHLQQSFHLPPVKATHGNGTSPAANRKIRVSSGGNGTAAHHQPPPAAKLSSTAIGQSRAQQVPGSKMPGLALAAAPDVMLASGVAGFHGAAGASSLPHVGGFSGARILEQRGESQAAALAAAGLVAGAGGGVRRL